MDLEKYRFDRSQFGRAEDQGRLPSRAEAAALLASWVPNDRLRLHMYQVAALLETWAAEHGRDAGTRDLWYLAGLLHDADWERWPDEHCRRIIAWLEEGHYDARLIRAIACHSPRFFGVEPESELENLIYAFDELSGFVHAVSLVRPAAYTDLAVASVRKKLKEKSFAAQVDRSDIEDGLARSGQDFDGLCAFVIRVQAGVKLPG